MPGARVIVSDASSPVATSEVDAADSGSEVPRSVPDELKTRSLMSRSGDVAVGVADTVTGPPGAVNLNQSVSVAVVISPVAPVGRLVPSDVAVACVFP